MPALEVLTPQGAAMLDDLPPFMREDPDVVAIVHCQAREHERKRESILRVQANLFPQTADELGLPWWESLLGVGGAEGQTVEVRRETVMAYLLALHSLGTGAWWEATITRLAGPGWTYQEHVDGDAGSPPVGTVRLTLPFPTGSAQLRVAQQLVRRITDAHISLAFVASDTFLLDNSQLDQGLMQ